MNQKGNVLLIVLLIAAAIGGYLIYSGKFLNKSEVIYPQQTTQPSSSTETTNWKTYMITPDLSLGYESYQIKLPIMWKQVEHSSNFQSMETFQEGQHVYQLVIDEQKNHNSQTGQPFANLKELAGLPYDVTTLIVDGQQGIRPLPRAGSEYIYKALFFSRDAKLVYNITLKTPQDGSKIQEGETLFNKILSTFKFLDQNAEGKFCGGFAANLPENQCPEGYKCQLDGNYPDAGGKCTKK